MLTVAVIAVVFTAAGSVATWAVFVRGGRTRVTVEVTQKATRGPITILGDDPRPEPLFHAIEIAVINRGPVPEEISFLAVTQTADEPEAAALDVTGFLPGGTSTEVGVRKRVVAEVALNDLGFNPADGFVAVARLASGKTVESARELPDEGITAHIAQYNRTAKPDY